MQANLKTIAFCSSVMSYPHSDCFPGFKSFMLCDHVDVAIASRFVLTVLALLRSGLNMEVSKRLCTAFHVQQQVMLCYSSLNDSNPHKAIRQILITRGLS
jgi:hypothetical protein